MIFFSKFLAKSSKHGGKNAIALLLICNQLMGYRVPMIQYMPDRIQYRNDSVFFPKWTHPFLYCTTGHRHFAVCRKYTAKPGLHTAKRLTATKCRQRPLSWVFLSDTRQNFCYVHNPTLGKKKTITAADGGTGTLLCVQCLDTRQTRQFCCRPKITAHGKKWNFCRVLWI